MFSQDEGGEGANLLFGAMVVIGCFVYFPQHSDGGRCYSHFTDGEAETWRGRAGGKGTVTCLGLMGDFLLPSGIEDH